MRSPSRAHRLRVRVRHFGRSVALRRPAVVLGGPPLWLSGAAISLPHFAVARHLRAPDRRHLRALGLLFRRHLQVRAGVFDGRAADRRCFEHALAAFVAASTASAALWVGAAMVAGALFARQIETVLAWMQGHVALAASSRRAGRRVRRREGVAALADVALPAAAMITVDELRERLPASRDRSSSTSDRASHTVRGRISRGGAARSRCDRPCRRFSRRSRHRPLLRVPERGIGARGAQLLMQKGIGGCARSQAASTPGRPPVTRSSMRSRCRSSASRRPPPDRRLTRVGHAVIAFGAGERACNDCLQIGFVTREARRWFSRRKQLDSHQPADGRSSFETIACTWRQSF